MSAKSRGVKALLALTVVVLALGGCTGPTPSNDGSSGAHRTLPSDRDIQGAGAGGGY